jgi:hypothetical protein
MKRRNKVAFCIISVKVILVILYYCISLSLHNDFRFKHYISYSNKQDARNDGALLIEEVNFEIKGLDKLEESLIRDEVDIWVSKSKYQDFFGALFYLIKEDKKFCNVKIESNIGDNNKIIEISNVAKEVRLEGGNIGSLLYSSFEIPKDSSRVVLNLYSRKNKKEVKKGCIILDLKN